MNIEAEPAPFRERTARQVACPENEGSRPVREPAGGSTEFVAGLEQPGIGRGGSRIAQDQAQRPSDHVAALSRRKVDRIHGAEVETEPQELEFVLQNLPRSPAIMV